MQVVVNDLIVSYNRAGKGSKTILCVHGWADTSETFTGLTKQFGEYTFISVDLPGFGGTAAPPTAWTLDDYAHFIAAFIHKLELKVDVLIAHSNGGAIAIRALALKSIHINKLVLIASSGIRRPNSFRLQALKILAKSGKFVLHLSPPKTRTKLRRKLYKKIGSDYLEAEHMQDTFKNIVAQDVLDDARLIKAPTVLIYGDRDLSTPPAYGALLSDAIEVSKLHVIEGAGHFVHIDDTAETVKIIQEFLNEKQ
jgi:pimeloyl-ACP methyl ester carboxylesterase